MYKIYIICFTLAFFPFPGLARSSDEIKTACGGRARVVWCQNMGGGTDPGAEGTNLRLMAFDTDDGKGERCILTNLSNYAKPMLTPDGKKIIFSNRPERKIYVVNWDSSSLRQIADGFALALWRDPLTETDWIYAGTPVSNATYVVNIRRLRLDKPEICENIWSKTPLDIDNFQLSADGQYACGVFPWPACGIAALPDRGWEKYGDGCWPSLSPDSNLLLWIFDGAHRNLTLFQTKTDERWVVNINSVPGIDGFEVYHPRWSNHPLFMVMTGPYKLGDGSNRIRGGGKDVEIYLGKFSRDFRKVERWIQVTHNEYADFYPDAWFAEGRAGLPVRPPAGQKNGATGCLALPDRMIAGEQVDSKIGDVDVSWPVSFDRLVFYWQNRSKANTFADPVTHNSYVCRTEAKGRARYGRHFEMVPSGGAFIADGGAGELLNACAASRQLGMEALITPGDVNFKDASKIASATVGMDSRLRGNDGVSVPCLSFPTSSRKRGSGIQDFFVAVLPNSTGNTNLLPVIGYAAQNGYWNFLLGQKDGRLVFQLRADQGGPDYVLDLGAFSVGKPNHVIVTCSSSSLICYLNGEQIFSADSIYGGNWQNGVIVFGNEFFPEYAVEPHGIDTGWKGLIENVALYSRWIGQEEARKKFKASIAHVAGRKQVPVLDVKAKLIAMPIVPPPASIAPYRRALIAGHYRVEEIVDGKCPDKEIMAVRWAILDGKVINSMHGNFQKVGPDCGSTELAEVQSGRKDDGTRLSRPTSRFCDRKEGETISMRLELFSDHPELEGERLIMDSDRFDLPMYYEVGDY